MKLETGAHLGPYEVVGAIGAGGMGEVWRARDTRLGRDVAIKVLPVEYAANAHLHARLEREAQSISQLEHPNICRLYDIGNDAGTPGNGAMQYLVMEFLEGESLADMVARGPLPPRDVLRYGQQIASALDAAHRKGIIHRDVKPGNVVITRGGAKLLDFGLAKLAADAKGTADDLEALTAQKPLTAEGAIVGTFRYMAPEQLEGRDADARTDIFALGAVLYEMATGQRPFSGTSKASLIASIMSSQPEPVSRIQPLAPVALDYVIRKCLEKHADDRWQSAQDVAGQLQWIGEVSSSFGSEISPRPAAFRSRRWIMPVASAVAVALAAVGGWLVRGASRTAPAGDVVRSSIQLPKGIRLAGWTAPAFAISPDGKHLAFVGYDGDLQRLYLRRIDREDAIVVSGSESAEGPFFSPDSRHVGFAVGVSALKGGLPAELRRVSVDGGLAQPVCPLDDYFGGSWSADDQIYFSGRAGTGILKVPASGGTPRAITANDLDVSFPSLLPGGKTLFAVMTSEKSPRRIVAIDTGSGAVTDLGLDGSMPQYLPTGHLLYTANDRTLMVVPFDAGRLAVRGRGTPLLEDVAVTLIGEGGVAVSEAGTLVVARGFVSGSNRELTRLVRLAPDGAVTPLPFDPDTYSRRGISVSPDGNRIAATTWDGTLWISDLRRGTRLSLPRKGGQTGVMPLWSPDGKSLVFSAAGAGLDGIHMFVQAADGASPARQLTATLPRPMESWPTSWAGPRTLMFNYNTDPAGGVAILDIDEPAPAPKMLVAREGSSHRSGRVSPDGRWLVYHALEKGLDDLFVRRLDLGDGPVPIASGGSEPRWSPDGHRILFRSGAKVMAVDFRTAGDEPLPGPPYVLMEIEGLKSFDTVPGSEDLIAVVEEPGSGVQTSITMVQNWLREIEQGKAAASKAP